MKLTKILAPSKMPEVSSSTNNITVNPETDTLIKASHNVYRLKNGMYFKDYDGDAFGISHMLAYDSLAALLGIDRLLLKSSLCIACISGEKHIGTLSRPSKGINVYDMPSTDRISALTPEFHKDVTILRLFDVICNELDHSLNNYFPVMEGNKFISVEAFDNGSIGTFNLHSDVSSKTYYGCDSLIDTRGELTFPYMDSGFASRILSCTFHQVSSALSPYLGTVPVFLTWKRIRKVKKALKKAILINEDQWSSSLIDMELSGEYGNTYIYSLVHQWGSDIER